MAKTAGMHRSSPARPATRRKDTKRYGAPDPLADINNSMNFAWGFVEFLPRKVPRTSFYRQLQIGKVYFPVFDYRRFRRAPSCTKR
jgi:hypothetical protein